MQHRALFIDRDGTLVHARHYPSRPEELVIYDGIAAPLRRLQEAGFLLIVITNQAGLARGYFTERDLHVMHEHLASEFAALGVHIDGIYYCPHHPEGVVAEWKMVCECRKPAPGMLVRAAAEHEIDLAHSWFVGDILDDVEAGNRAGCRTVLVDLGTESPPTHTVRQPTFVARDTSHALKAIAYQEGLGSQAELDYLPSDWSNCSEQPQRTLECRRGLKYDSQHLCALCILGGVSSSGTCKRYSWMTRNADGA